MTNENEKAQEQTEIGNNQDEYPSWRDFKKRIGNMFRPILAAVTYVNSNRPSPIVDDRPLKEYGLAGLGYASGESYPIDLRPYIDKKIPPDSINESNGKLLGNVYFFQVGDESLNLEKSEFNANIDEPLPPFKYKKPVIGKDVFHVDEVWEEKDRQRYYPLVIVRNAYRGPNHWHRRDDGLFCAVMIDGAWQTRYFPKSNIPEEIWEKANELLS